MVIEWKSLYVRDLWNHIFGAGHGSDIREESFAVKLDGKILAACQVGTESVKLPGIGRLTV